jgi:hypothetical protein
MWLRPARTFAMSSLATAGLDKDQPQMQAAAANAAGLGISAAGALAKFTSQSR